MRVVHRCLPSDTSHSKFCTGYFCAGGTVPCLSWILGARPEKQTVGPAFHYVDFSIILLFLALILTPSLSCLLSLNPETPWLSFSRLSLLLTKMDVGRIIS